jgi:hypothetical protein
MSKPHSLSKIKRSCYRLWSLLWLCIREPTPSGQYEHDNESVRAGFQPGYPPGAEQDRRNGAESSVARASARGESGLSLLMCANVHGGVMRKGGKCLKSMERETGFEPATSTLARSHSTTELLPLDVLDYNGPSNRASNLRRLARALTPELP